MEDYLKVIVAGEVDAGKSSLIGRFLYEAGAVSRETIQEIEATCKRLKRNFEFAYLLDSLEEERKGQLTIDTTQVFCRNKKGRGLLFIDTPGHRELLKNMLCGSSYGELAILVVDAKKSLEEGTRRHINILKFLGIEKIVVVCNKMDLADFEFGVFKKVESEMSAFFKETGLEFKYFIPVSARGGENLIKRSKAMPWYRGLPLIDALFALGNEQKEKKYTGFYFPIQDVYEMGKEKIFVGSVVSGRIHRGETARISLLNRDVTVRTIRSFDKTKLQAQAKEAVGITLSEPNDVKRGQIIYKTNPPELTQEVRAKIFCVSPINISDTLIFKCLAQESSAKIKKIIRILDASTFGASSLGEGMKEADIAEVVIATENPIAVKKFHQVPDLGRFVLENNGEICAAGIIL